MLSVWVSQEYNKGKQSRKFFVSPVKFTKVHVKGFVNEPSMCKFGSTKNNKPVEDIYNYVFFLVKILTFS